MPAWAASHLLTSYARAVARGLISINMVYWTSIENRVSFRAQACEPAGTRPAEHAGAFGGRSCTSVIQRHFVKEIR